MPVTTRKLWIEPVGDAIQAAKVQELLSGIDDHYYIAANLVVADCFNEYWTQKSENIEYLKDQERIKTIEAQIAPTIVKMHDKETGAEEKERLRTHITSLKQEKNRIVYHEQKRKLSKECAGKPILQHLIQRFPAIPKDVLFQTVFLTTQRFLKELENIRAGTYKYPYYTKGAPFPIGFDENFTPLTLDAEGKNIFFTWKADANTEIPFKINFGKDNGGVRKVIEWLVNAENYYKLIGDSAIKIDRNRERIFLHLIIKEPAPIAPPLDKNLTLGVDIGYNVPIVWGLSTQKEWGMIGDMGQIKHLRQQFNKKWQTLSKSMKDSRKGHGTKRKAVKLERGTVRMNERNFFRNLYRSYAKQLVEVALAKGVGIIKLEEPNFKDQQEKDRIKAKKKNIEQAKAGVQKKEQSPEDKRLESYRFWAFRTTLKYIQEKAEKAGIEVVYIKPDFTSKQCHRCDRRINKDAGEKREGANLIFNTKCNKEDCVLEEREIKTKESGDKYPKKRKKWIIHADMNAAFNIAKWPVIVPKIS